MRDRRFWIVTLVAGALALSGCGVGAGGPDPSGSRGSAPAPAVLEAKPKPSTSKPARPGTSKPKPGATKPKPTKSPRPRPTRPAAEPSGPRPVQRLQGPFDVVDVVDGDTVKIATADGVIGLRLIGIDTPETVHPSQPVECFGPEASAEATRLLAGQRVWIELDATQGLTDRYGRTLAYVWMAGERNFNWHMVRRGFASEYTYDDPYNHRQAFIDAQNDAMAARAGMWGTCQPGAAG